MIGPILRYVEYVPRVSINVKQSANTHRAFKEWYDMYAELDANGMTVEFQTKEDTINEYTTSYWYLLDWLSSRLKFPTKNIVVQ